MALTRSSTLLTTSSFITAAFRERRWASRASLDASSLRLLHSLRVLFCGTDAFSLQTLKSLYEASTTSASKDPSGRLVQSIEVLCPGDRRQGRGKQRHPCPVKSYAIEKDLIVHEVPEGVRSLRLWEASPFDGKEYTTSVYDIGVVVSFGYFIPRKYLELMRYGALNLHPSLLPKYRGPAPIQHALLAGETETGLSVIGVSPKKFDVGPILHQEKMAISPSEMKSELATRLAERGAEAMIETLRHYEDRVKIAVSQEAEAGCHAPKITKEMSNVFFSDISARNIFLRFRAISEDFGGLHARLSDGSASLKLTNMCIMPPEFSPYPNAIQLPHGTAYFGGGKDQDLLIKAGDGQWVQVRKLRLEGRKEASGQSFANGYLRRRRDCVKVGGGYTIPSLLL